MDGGIRALNTDARVQASRTTEKVLVVSGCLAGVLGRWFSNEKRVVAHLEGVAQGCSADKKNGRQKVGKRSMGYFESEKKLLQIVNIVKIKICNI